MYIHVFIVGVSMDVSGADPLYWISVRVSSHHGNNYGGGGGAERDEHVQIIT